MSLSDVDVFATPPYLNLVCEVSVDLEGGHYKEVCFCSGWKHFSSVRVTAMDPGRAQ